MGSLLHILFCDFLRFIHYVIIYYFGLKLLCMCACRESFINKMSVLFVSSLADEVTCTNNNEYSVSKTRTATINMT